MTLGCLLVIEFKLLFESESEDVEEKGQLDRDLALSTDQMGLVGLVSHQTSQGPLETTLATLQSHFHRLVSHSFFQHFLFFFFLLVLLFILATVQS